MWRCACLVSLFQSAWNHFKATDTISSDSSRMTLNEIDDIEGGRCRGGLWQTRKPPAPISFFVEERVCNKTEDVDSVSCRTLMIVASSTADQRAKRDVRQRPDKTKAKQTNKNGFRDSFLFVCSFVNSFSAVRTYRVASRLTSLTP